ncbi:50S ribosomal protein L25 [Litorimonas cladophorae]|uniref:Large ribosomal subunit protein bL25 n=1 Tax=Litorimonas cladophorae TaxID=1220491 RepID=A0A918KBX2_9PROT|nr:50S ribosomal protein L25/general stress protein Ctc [Litorimonas cladophorae]GGX56533.1 50S ribosomal protein L25 [Litorimonas cladophorae]
MSVVLDVVVREETGTGNAREARRNGMVPGVIYGGDKAPVSVGIKFNEVQRAINSGQFLSNMIELSHDGKPQKVLTKDVQFHPVTDMPLHIDFYRVTEKTIIDVDVSAVFVGEDVSPGMKAGGALNVVRYNIEVKCPAGAIPEHIEVDISGMEIGDSIHLSEVKLPKGVKPGIADRDVTIATIVASRTSKTADEEADDAAAAEAAGGDAAAAEGAEG